MLANVAYGSGDPGDSEYGEKAEDMAFVGDGIIGLFSAMVESAALMLIILRSYLESLSRDHDQYARYFIDPRRAPCMCC